MNNLKKPEYKDGRWEVDGTSYDGHYVLWSFSYEPEDYLKESELSGNQWRKGGQVKVFRNGVCVYNEFCRTQEQALRMLTWVIPLLQEHSIFLGAENDWQEKIVGRKIYHRDIPAVVESFHDGEVLIRTADGKSFPKWAHQIEAENRGEDYPDEWKDKDRISILSEKIYWFRD